MPAGPMPKLMSWSRMAHVHSLLVLAARLDRAALGANDGDILDRVWSALRSSLGASVRQRPPRPTPAVAGARVRGSRDARAAGLCVQSRAARHRPPRIACSLPEHRERRLPRLRDSTPRRSSICFRCSSKLAAEIGEVAGVGGFENSTSGRFVGTQIGRLAWNVSIVARCCVYEGKVIRISACRRRHAARSFAVAQRSPRREFGRASVICTSTNSPIRE